MWRNYIVLRAREGGPARGFVRMNFRSRPAQVQAQASAARDEEYELVLIQGNVHRLAPMQWRGGVAYYNGPMDVLPCFTIAVVRAAGGPVTAMGESSGPALRWADIERKILRLCPAPPPGQGPKPAHLSSPRPGSRPEPPRRGQGPGCPGRGQQGGDNMISRAEPEDMQVMGKHMQMTEEKPPQPDNVMKAAEPMETEPFMAGVITDEAVAGEHTTIAENVVGPNLGGMYEGRWSWRRISYYPHEDLHYYLMGSVESQGMVQAVAVAVPGEYDSSPPSNLSGFSGYAEGYWILAQDAGTGERIPVGEHKV